MGAIFATGVYAIENLRTGAVYVGGTRHGFMFRWIAHRGLLLLGHHSNKALQADWNTYGSGWFKFVVLEEIDASVMTAQDEQRWLDRMKDQNRICYNIGPVFAYPDLAKVQKRVELSPSDMARILGLPNPSIPGLPDDQPILTVDEVADYLLLNRKAILRLLITKKLVGFRTGQDWRITKHAVANFIGAQRRLSALAEAVLGTRGNVT